MMNIKRFINQKCLGYSRDFKYAYFEHVVELATGEIKTVYSVDPENNVSGVFTETKPIIPILNKND